jgi:pimeloyl-ACP methyl ester carboxylesterase
MNKFQARDGLNISYTVDDFCDPWREPEYLLLLHAAMGNAQRWYAWVPALARDFRVIRMELRGHGASDQPSVDQPFSLQDLVNDTRELLDHLGVKQVHLVGNSAGGYVSQQFAIQHPTRVKTLALYGSTPGLKHSHALTWLPLVKQKGLRNFLAETIHERFDSTADPALVHWFLDQAGSNDPAFIERFVSHMCTHDFMEELRQIHCPTMIVAAGKEQIGHVGAYRDMQQRIAGSQLFMVDTAGHNICDGYAAHCLNLLQQFLRSNGYPNGGT